jgi:hypothetical protein
MLNPQIPDDFGSDDHLDRLRQLAGNIQKAPRDQMSALLKKSNDELSKRMTTPDLAKQNLFKGLNNIPQSDQPQSMDALFKGLNGTPAPAAAPSFRTPGEAHAGQGGYDYNNDPDQSDAETARLARSGTPGDPKGQAHAGQGGYDYNDDTDQNVYDYDDITQKDDPDQSDAETARLGRYNAPSNPKGQAHAGQGGYDYNDDTDQNVYDYDDITQGDDPDQSDAETARLGRAGTPNTPNDRKMNDANYLGELARMKFLAQIR